MELIKINGKTYNEIIAYTQTFEQLWKDGSGRSPYTAKWNGQILGNFEPIKVTLHVFDDKRLSDLVNDLRKGSIKVTHYDIATRREKTVTFYRATYSVGIKQFYDGGKVKRYDAIEIEFIPHDPV